MIAHRFFADAALQLHPIERGVKRGSRGGAENPEFGRYRACHRNPLISIESIRKNKLWRKRLTGPRTIKIAPIVVRQRGLD